MSEISKLQKKLEKLHRQVIMTREREEHINELRMAFEKEMDELRDEVLARYIQMEIDFLKGNE